MKPNTHFQTHLAFGLLTVLALAGSGCGGSGDSCEATRTCPKPAGDGDGDGDGGAGSTADDTEDEEGKESGDGDRGDGDTESSSGDGDDEPVPCADGTWDHDEDPETECQDWSSCAPGQFVSEEGSPTSDRECSVCEDGTFSEEDNTEECSTWTECPSGLSQSGSATSDVECSSPAVDVAVGDGFSCILREDGTVACWGKNDLGQLGRGHTEHSGLPQPVMVEGQDGPEPLTGVVQVSAGAAFACVVRENGTVWCWGANAAGQLGTGTYEDGDFRPVAAKIATLESVAKINTGVLHTCALLEDRTARCWGAQGTGYQLGGGPDPDEHIVTVARATNDLSPLTDIRDIAVGDLQTCAAVADGSAYCWGIDPGMGTGPEVGINISSSVPKALPAFDDEATHVVAGSKITCWLLVDARIKCHGDAPMGGEFVISYGPLEVGLPTHAGQWVKVAVGSRARCILFEHGDVYCWGRNEAGQLGDGSTEDSAELVQVDGLQDIIAIDAGYSHACAVQDTGRVYCWGKNENGEVGDNTIFGSTLPISVPDVANAVALTSGSDHTCALLDNGKVKCWGKNDLGQLGIGGDIPSSGPVQLGISDVTDVSAKFDLTYATKADHTLRVWGTGLNGEVAVSTVENVEQPTDMIKAVPGLFHACGVHRGGALSCWGNNFYGALGTSAGMGATDYVAPFQVQDVDQATDVGGGYSHTCAVSSSAVTCWGLNQYGQVGKNGNYYSGDRYVVPNLEDVIELAVGEYFNLARREDGSVAAWGRNNVGQLGVTGVDSTADGDPVLVEGVENAMVLAAGDAHACAILEDGTAMCWGSNDAGQVGTSSESAGVFTPVAVEALSAAIDVSAGAQHTCALHESGTVSCWGSNQYYQLGHDRVTAVTEPREINWQ